MGDTYKALQERLRTVPLNERLAKIPELVGQMCSKGRPPRMTVPVQWDDDDVWISTTVTDALARIAELEAEVKAKEDFAHETYEAGYWTAYDQAARG